MVDRELFEPFIDPEWDSGTAREGRALNIERTVETNGRHFGDYLEKPGLD